MGVETVVCVYTKGEDDLTSCDTIRAVSGSFQNTLRRPAKGARLDTYEWTLPSVGRFRETFCGGASAVDLRGPDDHVWDLVTSRRLGIEESTFVF